MAYMKFTGDGSKILWSLKSPQPGDPTCLCSYCGAMIPEDAVPLICWKTDKDNVTLEARFCDECAERYFGLRKVEGADEFEDD